MDPRNPTFGPLNLYGYDAVGPGWHPILSGLDSLMLQVMENAKVKCSIKILQIKEKFGGLRIYWESGGLDDKSNRMLDGAVWMAENMSFRTCERCGDTADTETRPRRGTRLSRTLTLCGLHHVVRDTTGTIQLGKSTV